MSTKIRFCGQNHCAIDLPGSGQKKGAAVQKKTAPEGGKELNKADRMSAGQGPIIKPGFSVG
jgi:hypothetical protein